MRKVLMMMTLLAAAVSSSWAQLNTASISGQVTDPGGAAVPGAAVLVHNKATGADSKLVSNGSGFYSFQNLPIGDFSVTATAPGFERYVRSNITLTTAQALELDLKLTLGKISETVEVSGGAPLVETRTSDYTQFIESKTVSDVPLGNRKTMNVVQTIGAAVFLNDNPGGSQPTYSLAGGRVQSQMTFLDGGLTQNFRLGAGQQSIDPPIDAIREIQVVASTYPAQYGASNGGIVIESSKSGANHVHASAYEFLRNEVADAPGYFAPFYYPSTFSGPKVTPKNRYNIYGGTIGGPIRRDKTFFFFATEIFRWNQGTSQTLNVPSAAEHGGDFSQILGAPLAGSPVNPCDNTVIRAGQIYNPATERVVGGVTCRDSFPGNIIPSGSQDSVGAKILSFYPTPAGSSTATQFTGNVTSMTHTDFYLIKIDHELTQRDHIQARYMYYQNNIDDTSVYPDKAADPVVRPDGSTTMVYTSETHTFSNTKVNNFGFSYYRRTGTSFGYAYNGNYPQKLGLAGVPQVSFPAINVAGLSGLGAASQGAGSILTQEQYLDDFSWIVAKHALKLGGEFRGSRGDGIQQTATSSGTFGFVAQSTSAGTNAYTANTGNAIASLLVGAPGGAAAFSISNGVPVDRRTQYLAFYGQDDWTVSRSLTLNLGLRWETDFPESDARNRLSGFDANQTNPVSGTPGVVKFAGIDYPNKAWNGNWTNFSPRLGFAWKPFNGDRTVLRGGWGVYFGPPIDNTSWGGANLGYSSQASVASSNTIATPPFFLRNGVPGYTLVSPALNDSYGAVAAPYTNASTAVSYFPRVRPTERSYEFNLNVEHQLNSTMVVSVSGLSNLGRQLTSNNQQTDQIAPATLAYLAANNISTGLQAYRPFPQFNGVTQIAPVIGTSNYFGGVLRLEKRYSHGYNFVTTFTKAKMLSDVNDNANASSGNLGNNNGIFSNYYNRGADYGPTENDVETRFTFSAAYELPFGHGKQWLQSGVGSLLLGGWEISNLSVFQSGASMTVITQTNNTNAFSSGNQRPNQNGNPNLSRDARRYHYANSGAATWFNTAVFSQPAAYTFGNERNGVLRAPGFVNSDFSLLKRFALPETTNLEIRLDAFNAFNITQPGLPNLVFGSPTFGQITGPNGNVNQNRRTMELGARFSF